MYQDVILYHMIRYCIMWLLNIRFVTDWLQKYIGLINLIKEPSVKLINPIYFCNQSEEAEPSMKLINPIYFCSKSVTNLVSEFGFFSMTIKLHFHSQIHDLRKPMYKLCNISCNWTHFNSSKLSISHFNYFLKIVASQMFTYNVLLLFNFKRFLPFQ